MISQIFHVSDIHIRLTKRHDEYELVFRRLYEYIKKNKDKNSVIFLGGDIVHNKLELSPELVLQTANFLKSCADILPTILIQGNHDALLNNPNRLDSLTPIVSTLNHPNLHYWKDSGVYKLNGVKFSVFGCADSPVKWVPASKIRGKHKIALHHGSVKGSFTDAEHEIETGITLEHFQGFNLGLLGDIHMAQFLNEEKTIGYSSSLLQQNHGESLEGHGLIVWDLKTKQGKFVEIPNDFGYATFNLVGGHCAIPDNMPPNLRVRVNHVATEKQQVDEFVKRLGKQYKIIELTKQKIPSAKTTEKTHQIIGDSRDVSYQNANITELLKSLDLGVTDEELQTVCELNAEINKSLPTNNSHRNITWKPVVLEFDNMFSYGQGNVIDFTHLTGVFGLFDTNISGKSSIFDVLCFVLFDKTTRASKASHILNNLQDSFWCKIQFAVNGKDYFIERVGTKKKDGNVKVDVNFWTHSDVGDKVMLNGEDRDKTNYQIRNLVGTYEDFVMTSLSTQYDNQNFIEKTQKDRKELLYKFLDITVYDDLLKIAKEQGRECQVLLKEYAREDLHVKSSLIYAQIGAQQEILDSATKHLHDKKEWLKTQMTGFLELNKGLQQIGDGASLDSIQRELEKVQSEIEACQKEIAKTHQDQFAESHQTDKIQKEIDEFGNITGTYRDLTLQHNELSKKVTTAKHDLEQSQKQLQQAKSHQDKLSKHEYDPNCQYCCNNEFVKEASKLIEQIPILENEIKTRNAEHVELVGLLEISHSEVRKAEAFENLLKSREDSKTKFQRFTDLADSLQYKYNSLQTELAQNLGRLEKYKENEKAIEENKLTHQRIKSLKLEIAQTEAEIQQLEGQEKTEFSKLANLRAQHSAIDEKLDKYAEYAKKSRVYELYQTAVGRDGVPYRILETVLPVIESEVNSILNSMVNFTVKMESTDDKYITANIVYDDVKYWPVELSSGMERFVLSLAFRSSLTEITSLPKANFLTIDEGFGVLDSENLMSMGNLFNFLKQQYDFIICVSHIDTMRDLVDSHIKIDKFDGYSRIKL